MPQTLTVFLAMLVLITFFVGQQRNALSTHGRTYQRETQMAATDFALRRFAEMSGKKFGARVSRTGTAPVVLDSLAAPEDLGQEGGSGDFDDLDDYHDPDGESVQHLLNDRAFGFVVTTEVRYADPDNVESGSGSRQLGKRVTITVYKDAAARDAGRFCLRLSRVYTVEGVAA